MLLYLLRSNVLKEDDTATSIASGEVVACVVKLHSGDDVRCGSSDKYEEDWLGMRGVC